LRTSAASTFAHSFYNPSLHSIGVDSILDSLSDKERKRQEAMFEFIATEASYVRDLQLIVGVRRCCLTCDLSAFW
jgi:hypothetical protein